MNNSDFMVEFRAVPESPGKNVDVDINQSNTHIWFYDQNTL